MQLVKLFQHVKLEWFISEFREESRDSSQLVNDYRVFAINVNRLQQSEVIFENLMSDFPESSEVNDFLQHG